MEQRDNQVEQPMENTSNMQHGERAEGWPALPYEAWRDTCQTLHLWTQIVGKVRMELSPFLNLCWLLWSSVQKISLLSLFGDDHDAFHMPFFRTDVRSSHNNNYVGGYCLNKRVGRL